MKFKPDVFQIVSLAAMLQPSASEAHPFHWSSESVGFLSGLVHPWSGSDHIIAMLIVGFWIPQANRSATMILSLVFALLLLIGGGLTLVPVEIPYADNLTNLSALVLGLMLVGGYKASPVVMAVIVGNLAFFQGYVNAYDIWLDSDAFSYTAGFTLATLVLISIGMLLRTLIARMAQKHAGRYLDETER